MANQMRLDTLQPELLTLICEFVDDTSPRTTRALALTNKYLCSVVKLTANRHKTLRIEAFDELEKLPEIVNKWADDQDLLVNIRTLTVEGFLQPYPNLEVVLNDKDLWEPLAGLISKIGKLRLLNWNLPSIPLVVLNALHVKQRFATLRMFKFEPSPATQPSEIDKALAESPALTHLRTETPHHSLIYPNMQEYAFRRIVSRAPLQYAGIIHRLHSVDGDPQVEAARRLFLKHSRRNSTVRTLTLDGYPMSKATLDEWSSIVDLTLVENIKFSRGAASTDYFQNAASMLPNLKHVSLNFSTLVQMHDGTKLAAIQHYLYNCPPLESLSLWSWNGIVELEELVKQHGSSLKVLQLHERETPSTQLPRTLTLQEVQSIVDSCPKLKDLTLDLVRPARQLQLSQEDPNMAYLDLLREAKLNSLQVYFDVGLPYILTHMSNYAADPSGDFLEDDDTDDDDDNGNSNNEENEDEDDVGDRVDGPATKRRRISKPTRPSKEEDLKKYSEDIWQVVFKHAEGGPRKLDVKFGDWEGLRNRWVRGALLESTKRRHARHIIVRPAERDDQKQQCTTAVIKLPLN